MIVFIMCKNIMEFRKWCHVRSSNLLSYPIHCNFPCCLPKIYFYLKAGWFQLQLFQDRDRELVKIILKYDELSLLITVRNYWKRKLLSKIVLVNFKAAEKLVVSKTLQNNSWLTMYVYFILLIKVHQKLLYIKYRIK